MRQPLILVAVLAVVMGTAVTLRQARVGPAAAQGAGWSDLASLSEPRQEVAVAALDGVVYVAGGLLADGGRTAAFEAYDPATDRWSSLAPLPIAVDHAASAVSGGQVFVVGGFVNPSGDPTDGVFAYDPATNQWSRRASMPTPRGALVAAAVDGKIYAVGGLPGERDLAAYDPAADVWTVLPPMPTPRNHGAAAAIGGKIYVAGGRSASITNALEEFDPATNSWSARTPMPTARGGIGGAALNGLLYVFGGENNRRSPVGMFDEVEVYNPAADSWRRLPPMAIPVHGIGAAAVGNRIYIPGGAVVEGFGAVSINQAFEPN